jgi:hypothetical protein
MYKLHRPRQAGQAGRRKWQAGRPGRGKHMAGTGRLEGSTACRRPARPMKSRPVWTSDGHNTVMCLVRRGRMFIEYKSNSKHVKIGTGHSKNVNFYTLTRIMFLLFPKRQKLKRRPESSIWSNPNLKNQSILPYYNMKYWFSWTKPIMDWRYSWYKSHI